MNIFHLLGWNYIRLHYTLFSLKRKANLSPTLSNKLNVKGTVSFIVKYPSYRNGLIWKSWKSILMFTIHHLDIWKHFFIQNYSVKNFGILKIPKGTENVTYIEDNFINIFYFMTSWETLANEPSWRIARELTEPFNDFIV